jgi:hypothetical protein
MIVRFEENRLLLINQADHARAAGQFAACWGNDTFARPEPFASVCTAAARHDDGWIAWDAEPQLNPDTRLPCQFAHLPVDTHFDLYERLKLAAACEPRINETGRDPREALHEYINYLRARQNTLHDELADAGLPPRVLAEAHVHANSRLIQFYDTLSLYLCTAPTAAECTLGPVPLNYDGDETTIALRPLNDKAVGLSPYPFCDEVVRVSIPAAAVPNQQFDSDEHLRDLLDRQPQGELLFELRPA